MDDRDGHWTVRGSRGIVRDRWIDLRADDCVTPSGQTVAPFYVLTYPDWICVVAITPSSDMVLVRQYRHAAGAVLTEIPAGGMEAGDADADQAARRELLEETSYVSDRWEAIGTLYPNPSSHSNRMHVFLAHDAVQRDAPRLDAGEEGLTVQLMLVAGVRAGLRSGLIGQAMHVAAIFLALDAVNAGSDAVAEPVPGERVVFPVAREEQADERQAGMTIYGLDFTSAPSRSKPLTVAECRLDEGVLTFQALHRWTGFEPFTHALARPGPWIMGLDFPFGQSRTFIENIGWPADWATYVGHVAGLSRAEFCDVLTAYRNPRAAGDKEHQRAIDGRTGGISPQKLFGVPVGLMFYEGAPRLLASDVHIPLLRDGDRSRIVVEAYPGVMARRLIGRRSYKNDMRARQTPDLLAARVDLLARLCDPDAATAIAGLRVEAPSWISGDPSGDVLDALLCAVQAAWAWQRRDRGFGIPPEADPLEGWIVDPGTA